MKRFALILVFCQCLSLTLALNQLFSTHLWESFKKSHNKVYLSKEHEDHRFSIFNKNLDLIEKHNLAYSQGLYTYTLGINSYADMTVEEFQATMHGTRHNMSISKGSSGTFVRLPSQFQTPLSVDWRELGAVTDVKNQGQCGSCWAFSTTGSVEAAHFRATKKLVSLSEQQLVDCSQKFNNNGCNGGIMDNAFEYIKSIGGLDTEVSYSYHAKAGKCHYNKNTVAATVSGYMDIPTGDEDALKEALASVGPVSIAIDANDKFMLYKDGVYVDETCSNGQDDLDHGVLAVGYGTNKTNDGESIDYWIVKNSWGTSWGEGGYVRMARNKNNMCGVATMASYPLTKDTN